MYKKAIAQNHSWGEKRGLHYHQFSIDSRTQILRHGKFATHHFMLGELSGILVWEQSLAPAAGSLSSPLRSSSPVWSAFGRSDMASLWAKFPVGVIKGSCPPVQEKRCWLRGTDDDSSGWVLQFTIKYHTLLSVTSQLQSQLENLSAFGRGDRASPQAMDPEGAIEGSDPPAQEQTPAES